MGKISFGQKLKGLFGKSKVNEEFFEELTDTLIEGDIGAKTSFEIAEMLEESCKKKKIERNIRWLSI